MPPSRRYMLRLPPPLDAAVQARIAAGTPFPVLVRAALTAYLSAPPGDTRLTEADTPGDTELTVADSLIDGLVDTVDRLAARLAHVDARLQALEARTTAADMVDTAGDRPGDTAGDRVDRVDTPGAHPDTPSARRGAMRRQIVALLQAHPDGLAPAQIRDRLGLTRDLSNILYAMARDGLLRRVERGRYGVATEDKKV